MVIVFLLVSALTALTHLALYCPFFTFDGRLAVPFPMPSPFSCSHTTSSISSHRNQIPSFRTAFPPLTQSAHPLHWHQHPTPISKKRPAYNCLTMPYYALLSQ